jgi:hypothetical protein
MRKFALPVLAIVVCILTSCGSGYKLLAQERASAASALKASCEENSVEEIEVTIADSLYDVAAELRAKGNHREAFERLDFAVILYQLALAKSTLQETIEENQELETELKVAQSKLATYERILQELKADAE